MRPDWRGTKPPLSLKMRNWKTLFALNLGWTYHSRAIPLMTIWFVQAVTKSHQLFCRSHQGIARSRRRDWHGLLWPSLFQTRYEDRTSGRVLSTSVPSIVGGWSSYRTVVSDPASAVSSRYWSPSRGMASLRVFGTVCIPARPWSSQVAWGRISHYWLFAMACSLRWRWNPCSDTLVTTVASWSFSFWICERTVAVW